MKRYIERIIGGIFAILGAVLIVYGNYEIMEKNNNKTIDEDKNSNEIIEKFDDKEVIEYLKNKYNKDFQLVKKEKEYCLANGTYNLYYTDTCDNQSVVNRIYRVKSLSDEIEFIVKYVSYDKNVLIPDSEITNESKGFYDNYISYIVAKKLEEYFLSEYQKIYGNDISLNIYKGIGIYDINQENSYQYLDNKFQNISDTNIEINDFIDLVSDATISISIKNNSEITKDNFQDNVDMIYLVKDIKIVGLFVDNIIVEYKNDERYIEYDNDLKILELKKGKDKYTYGNKYDVVYDKRICLVDNKTLDCINYNDFKLLDKNNFNF